MTNLATSIGAILAAGAVALGGALGADQDARTAGRVAGGEPARTALVVDASEGRDGRELIDPRLRELDAEVRLPRTPAEARTNVRYFDSLGYRVIVAGPQASAAARAVGVDAARAANLPQALQAAAG